MVLPSEDFVKNVMANVSSVTLMYDHALWSESATNVTTVPTKDVVSYVEVQEYLMPIIVRNAPSKRKIAMDVQKL